jgi:hypothetical protein
MQGPPELPFQLSGYFEFKLSIKGAFTSVIFSAPGKMILLLPDGSQLDISSKNVEVTGLLYKEKNFNVVDTMQIVDLQSSIVSLTTFDP